MSGLVGARLLMSDFATRMTAQFADPTIYVGTVLDIDYYEKFGAVWPAAWIGAIKTVPRDDGRGLTNILRQNYNSSVLIRLTVQRNPPAAVTTVSADVRAQQLHDKIVSALLGWTPPNAVMPLTLQSSVDGPAYEASSTIDLIFVTQTVYTRT